MTSLRSSVMLILLLTPFTSTAVPSDTAFASDAEVVDIGSRLEMFVDRFLIERMDGTHLKLHKPTAREVVIVHDEPWEGNTSGGHRIILDDGKYRMWYRGSHNIPRGKKADPESNVTRLSGDHQFVCYAESTDGIHWTKPHLGMVEHQGSKANNILWSAEMTRRPKGLRPCHLPWGVFKDTNPAAPDSERYKAISGAPRAGIYAFVSPDGIHWQQIGEGPILRETVFMDYTTSTFWDPNLRKYAAYLRDWWPGGIGGDAIEGNVRAVRYTTSDDFRHWAPPERKVSFSEELTRSEQLYTTCVRPYYRAQHLYLGFPKRYTHARSDNCTNDGLFMSSRDGLHFKLWREAIIRPGLQDERWVNRNNTTALGVMETKSVIPGLPNQLSIYSSEGYYGGPDGLGNRCRLRRYTYRMDGFVSIQASPEGGEFVTRPLVFRGKQLVLNFSTSAPGYIRVEIQDADGKPIEGFTLADSPTVYGDNIEYVMRWRKRGAKKGKYTSDVGRLAGKPVRLRFVMKEADLFTLRFRDEVPKGKRYTGFAIPGSKVVPK